MVTRKRLLFVINPISGGKGKSNFPDLIRSNLDSDLFDHEVYWWDQVDELEGRLRQFITDNGDTVVAVGGDGTVNLIAKELVNTSVTLAIVPMGSGNGLARELDLKLDPASAIRALNKGQVGRMDVGYLNGNQFVNVAGWGFDAQVSVAFSKIKKRGLQSYIKSIYQEFKSARNYQFTVEYENGSIQKEGFMLTVANGTQWGNNFFVAPDASYSDGWLDIVFLKKPGVLQIPGLVWSLFRKKDHHLMSRIRLKKATISSDELIYTHLDGEPGEPCKEIQLSIQDSALSLLV
ncbi:MAG: diacylglycerol kinase family lipid kinase [Bacteroidia bacterium]|nr:diacylglycerol kinase family lipid kinase [Bacteroidia bacterium]